MKVVKWGVHGTGTCTGPGILLLVHPCGISAHNFARNVALQLTGWSYCQSTLVQYVSYRYGTSGPKFPNEFNLIEFTFLVFLCQDRTVKSSSDPSTSTIKNSTTSSGGLARVNLNNTICLVVTLLLLLLYPLPVALQRCDRLRTTLETFPYIDRRSFACMTDNDALLIRAWVPVHLRQSSAVCALSHICTFLPSQSYLLRPLNWLTKLRPVSSVPIQRCW